MDCGGWVPFHGGLSARSEGGRIQGPLSGRLWPCAVLFLRSRVESERVRDGGALYEPPSANAAAAWSTVLFAATRVFTLAGLEAGGAPPGGARLVAVGRDQTGKAPA